MIDRETIGILGTCVVLVLILLRVPLVVAIGLVSFVCIALVTSLNAAWGIVTSIPFATVGEWSLSAIPMFLLMGYIAASGGLTGGLFEAMKRFLGRVPGGLACASVGACAFFASASGSSVATSAAMGRIAIPEMLANGYKPSLAAGTVAAAGTLGSLIPPSVLLVVYGIFAQQSIGQLFIAGFLPGLLTAAAYMTMIVVRSSLDKSLAPAIANRSGESLLRVLRDVWPLPVLILGVLGGIFGGVFSPTEAGAVGAILALAIAFFRGGLSLTNLKAAVQQTVEGTATIFLIAVSAAMFTRFMALSGMPNLIADFLTGISDDPVIVTLIICGILLVMGCFVDGLGIILLTLPVFLPILIQLDVNLIWFGILMIKLIEIGLVTPPVGLNLYVIKSGVGLDLSLGQISMGAFWFVLTDVIVLLVLVFYPQIALYLPTLMRAAG